MKRATFNIKLEICTRIYEETWNVIYHHIKDNLLVSVGRYFGIYINGCFRFQESIPKNDSIGKSIGNQIKLRLKDLTI